MLAEVPSFAPLAAATATVLAALGGILKVVLDNNARIEERQSTERAAAEERHVLAVERVEARQEKFLGNHMSGNTRAMERVADKLEALTDEVADVRRVVGWRP